MALWKLIGSMEPLEPVLTGAMAPNKHSLAFEYYLYLLTSFIDDP